MKKVYTWLAKPYCGWCWASVDIAWLLFWEGLVLHFNTRTTYKTHRAALHGGKAITQNKVWQICHTLLQQRHTALFRQSKA